MLIDAFIAFNNTHLTFKKKKFDIRSKKKLY